MYIDSHTLFTKITTEYLAGIEDKLKAFIAGDTTTWDDGTLSVRHYTDDRYRGNEELGLYASSAYRLSGSRHSWFFAGYMQYDTPRYRAFRIDAVARDQLSAFRALMTRLLEAAGMRELDNRRGNWVPSGDRWPNGEEIPAAAYNMSADFGAFPIHLSSSMRSAMIDWANDGDVVARAFLASRVLGGESTFVVQTDIADYLAIRKNGVISYRDPKKPVASPWALDGRIESRPGRLMQRLVAEEFAKTLTARDYELFSIRTKGQAGLDEHTVEEVTGDDIRHWYDGDNYSTGHTGDLGNSCMRYDECQGYFGIYTDNPEQVSLAIVRRNNKLIGRALVWTTDKGTRVIDRRYGTEGIRGVLAEWAREQGIENPSTGDTVTLKNPWHEKYPYMDTFTRIDARGRLLHYNTRAEGATVSLQSTGGGEDLSSGPSVCPDCGKASFFNNSGERCGECTDRRFRRLAAELVDACLAGNFPETLGGMNNDEQIPLYASNSMFPSERRDLTRGNFSMRRNYRGGYYQWEWTSPDVCRIWTWNRRNSEYTLQPPLPEATTTRVYSANPSWSAGINLVTPPDAVVTEWAWDNSN